MNLLIRSELSLFSVGLFGITVFQGLLSLKGLQPEGPVVVEPPAAVVC
jgi:hypothetical protein